MGERKVKILVTATNILAFATGLIYGPLKFFFERDMDVTSAALCALAGLVIVIRTKISNLKLKTRLSYILGVATLFNLFRIDSNVALCLSLIAIVSFFLFLLGDSENDI